MLGFSHRQEQRQEQVCTFCDGVGEHSSECPVELLKALEASRERFNCPECHGTVEVNVVDYWECRACQKQFVASSWTGRKRIAGRNILLGNDRAIDVQVLVAKGKKNFRIDDAIKRLKKTMRRHIAAQKKNDK